MHCKGKEISCYRYIGLLGAIGASQKCVRNCTFARCVVVWLYKKRKRNYWQKQKKMYGVVMLLWLVLIPGSDESRPSTKAWHNARLQGTSSTKATLGRCYLER